MQPNLDGHRTNPAGTSKVVIEIDFGIHGLRGPEGEVFVRRLDFQVLSLLVQAEGALVSKEEILRKLWKSDSRPARLHDSVSRIRKQFRSVGAERAPIVTKNRLGYLLRLDAVRITNIRTSS